MKRISEIFSQYKGLSKSAYVLFLGRMITNMGAFIWPLLTLILKDKMGYTPTMISYIFLIVGFLFLPANILGGKLADRFNRKKLIITFDCISVFFFILCAFVEPGIWMVIFFIIAGLFANIEGPAFDALVIDVVKPKDREKVYSLMYLGHNLGYMFGAAIGGLLFANYLSLAFVLDGITTLSSTMLIIMLVKGVQKMESEEENEYEEGIYEAEKVSWILKKRPSVFVQLLIFLMGAFVYNQWTYTLPMYMTDLFGDDLGSKYFGFLSSFNAFVVIFFTPIITFISQRFREIPKIFVGQLCIGLSFIIICNQPTYSIFFVMMFIFTIGEIANMLGSAPFISRRVPSSHRGRIHSYMNIAWFLGAAIGRVIIGWILEATNYSVTFVSIALFGVAGVSLVVYNYYLDRKIFPKLYSATPDQRKEVQNGTDYSY